MLCIVFTPGDTKVAGLTSWVLHVSLSETANPKITAWTCINEYAVT